MTVGEGSQGSSVLGDSLVSVNRDGRGQSVHGGARERGGGTSQGPLPRGLAPSQSRM